MGRVLRPLARADVLVQSLDAEVLVYDPRADRAVSLNHTAAAVWACCDGTRTVQQLVAPVAERLGAPVSLELVEFTLEELHAEGLVEGFEAASTSTGRMTRRDALRLIGLTTAVSVPLVVGIASPAAAQAQSVPPPLEQFAPVSVCGPVGGAGCVATGLSFFCPQPLCLSKFCETPSPGDAGFCL